MIDNLSLIYKECLERPERYLVLKGGAASGKTYFASTLIVTRTLEEKCNATIIRANKEDHRYSTFANILERIKEMDVEHLFEINKTTNSIFCIENGSKIMFTSPDDLGIYSKLKRASRIWIEEATEITAKQFQMIDGFIDVNSQIIMTFNPISKYHWIKERFFDNTDDDAYTVSTTSKDNPKVAQSIIDVLEGFKKTSPYHHQVYCLGEWGNI